MNRQVFFILLSLLIAAAAAGFFFYSYRSHATAANPHACDSLRIAAFGDSLVYGFGASTKGGFVSMLSTQLGAPIGNYGVPGNTTADALARIGQVTTAQPQVVLVLLGGNDALQKVPQATTQANLESILSQLQAAHAHVVLLGIMGGFPSDPYRGMFAALAKQYGVPYVPNVLSGLFGNASLMSDEVHPNDAGYQRIAARVAPALLEACAAATKTGS